MPNYRNRIVHGDDPEDPDEFYPFEDMRGRLQPKTEQLEVSARFGHRGQTIRKTGIRAVESRLVTVHFVLDWSAAQAALGLYNELRDGNEYEIYQAGISYGWFQVLEVVELPDTRACGSVINSILEAETGQLPLVMQYCGWTVVSSDGPEE